MTLSDIVRKWKYIEPFTEEMFIVSTSKGITIHLTDNSSDVIKIQEGNIYNGECSRSIVPVAFIADLLNNNLIDGGGLE